jgi:4-amino-4-deoxy-L-arabinose transferase-like glycosyltransferase
MPRVAARSRALTDRAALWTHFPLLCLLTLQGVVSLVILRNTAFQDEALYMYAGRQIMAALRSGSPLIDPFSHYLSGNPYFYPLVASILDAWGGVDAARMLSLVAVMGTTACVYWVTLQLFGRESAIFGTAIFAFQGMVLFLARLATYDASCLLFIALSALVALRGGTARTPLLPLGIGPLLVLAIQIKYAALLWVPSVLAILAWSTLQRRGWVQMALRVGLAAGSLLATWRLALAVLDDSFLVGLRGSTTNRAIGTPTPRLDLAWQVILLAGIGLGLAFIGCLLVARRQRLMAVLWFGSALLAPAYHIYKMEPVSLHKHMAYALFFAAPVAGYAVARFVNAYQHPSSRDGVAGHTWLPGLAVCLIVFMVGVQQAIWEYHAWGNTVGMATDMRALVRPNAGHYLAEDMEVARYYLEDVTADWQWTGPFWFQYTNSAHQHFFGLPAYKAALADGYFDVVELSYGIAAPLDNTVQSELGPGSHYALVAKAPYRNVYGSGYYWIWRKVVAGPPTRVSQSAVVQRHRLPVGIAQPARPPSKKLVSGGRSTLTDRTTRQPAHQPSQPVQPASVMVAVRWLHVRLGPSYSAAIWNGVSYGHVFPVLKRSGTWIQTTYLGRVVWIDGHWVMPGH